ncbi:MAG TPA: pentapeptide repeat-containing protein [Thermoguttaceae bacterium]|nr:pentapeptide repeat-containing protein [Thermoguttaceae bacterium]
MPLPPTLETCKENDCTNPRLLPDPASAAPEDETDLGLARQYCLSHAVEKIAGNIGDAQDRSPSLRRLLTTVGQYVYRHPQTVAFVAAEELEEVVLSDMMLRDSLFVKCNLTKASFRRANLERSLFFDCILTGADFSNASLNGSWLLACHANFASFEAADMRLMTLCFGTSADANENLPSDGVFGPPTQTDRKDSLEKIRWNKIVNSLVQSAGRPNKKENSGSSDGCEDNPNGGDTNSVELRDFLENVRQGQDTSVSEERKPLPAVLVKEDGQTTRFTGSDFSESIIRNVNLTGAVAVGCCFRGSDLSVTRLAEVNFCHANLQDCSLQRASLGDTDFSGADLSRANCAGCFTPDGKHPSVYFYQASLEGAVLTGCHFRYVDLAVRTAAFSDLTHVTIAGVPDDTRRSKVCGNFSNVRFAYSHFERCDLGEEGCPIVLRDADLSHCALNHVAVVAEKSDQPHDAALDSVNFAKARFLTSSTLATTGQDNRVVACDFTGATLAGVTLKTTNFIACSFENADLTGATLEDGQFKDCCFRDASLIGFLIGPKTSVPFWVCDFEKALLHGMRRADTADNGRTFFYQCSLVSASLRDTNREDAPTKGSKVDSGKGKPGGLNGKELAFVECTFELTKLSSIYNLDKVVILRGSLVDGQYFGYFLPEGNGSKEPSQYAEQQDSMWNPEEARKRVMSQLDDIVKETVGLVNRDDVPEDMKRRDAMYEGRKADAPDKTKHDGVVALTHKTYLWNMFANNFRLLGLSDLESVCRVRLKDAELEHRFNDPPKEGLGSSLWFWFLSLFFAWVGCMLYAGLLWASNRWPMIWPLAVIIPLLVVIVVIALMFGNVKSARGARGREWILHWKLKTSRFIYRYGESIGRAAATWVWVIVLFAGVYCATGVISRYWPSAGFDILDDSCMGSKSDASTRPAVPVDSRPRPVTIRVGVFDNALSINVGSEAGPIAGTQRAPLALQGNHEKDSPTSVARQGAPTNEPEQGVLGSDGQAPRPVAGRGGSTALEAGGGSSGPTSVEDVADLSHTGGSGAEERVDNMLCDRRQEERLASEVAEHASASDHTEKSIFGPSCTTWETALRCLYFSTVTFTTLGFGDLKPIGHSRVFAGAEACIGAILMAVFVLSFARRTMAR